MQVEYDPRSESYRVWVSNKDEYNFMKLLESPKFDPFWFLKNYQNSIYGKMVSDMGIYEKENKDMSKNYIVVHDKTSGLGIVFKDKIGGIFKDSEDGTAKLLVVDGYMLITTDKYEDIVKQIV